MAKLTRAIVGILAVSLAGLSSGCDRSPAQAGYTPPPPPVTVSTVTTADVPVYLGEIGKTSATATVTIEPQVSGKIISRDFVDGAELQAGQKLFEIDPSLFQASLDAANATLLQYQAQLSNANTNFDRIASLIQSKAVSAQDYDNAKSAVAVAQANVLAGQAAVETAKVNLEYCSITSPLDGRAGQRLVDVGNIVNANSTQLLVVQKISPIYADFTIPEDRLDEVRRNMAEGTLKVTVISPSAPNKPEEGELTFLDNAVQDGTGTIRLRATLKNEDQQFWPGQFVNVTLILATIKDAKLVPNESVQISQQGPYVFVVKDQSVAQQVFVTLGQRQGDNVVVEKGLNGDETVIKTGQLMVQDGRPVTIPKPATQPATQPASSQASAGTSS